MEKGEPSVQPEETLLPKKHENEEKMLQKKHAAMLERLSDLHQSRLQRSNLRKSDNNQFPSSNSTKSFLDQFSEGEKSIESSLDQIRISSNSSTRTQLNSELEKISDAIATLEKLISENSYSLPSYEVRSSLKTINNLKQKLDSVSADFIPRSKFTFRYKPVQKNEIVQPARMNKAPNPPPISIRVAAGFMNEENVLLEKDFRVSGEGDFTLSCLVSCEIRLRGCLRALFVNKLKDCQVYVGPVIGSVLIEEAENCVFMLASHQIRIHDVRNTDFYLRVRSRPIIEDSKGVRFAPYTLNYDGIEEALRSSGLEEENGSWAYVDDFKWLKAVQSPNWSVLPEDERVTAVNL